MTSRQSIITDPTISFRVVKNPFGEQRDVLGNRDMTADGWYVEIDCPITGLHLAPTPARATKSEAEADMAALIGVDG